MAVIVIYDGSTDTTASKLSELNYPWLQVMTLEKNGGKAGALNQGLAKVRSALTVTIDGDSYLYHNALNNLVRRYMSHLKKVPSLLGMGYLGDVEMDDPIYQNTRRFVWSEDNPCFFRGKAGEGIGGPHIGYDMPWPMSIMMKCFTAQSDDEIRFCMKMLLNTDAGMGFIHESFHKDDASKYTRPWFAWQNTLFGELVIKLINDGKADLLNNL